MLYVRATVAGKGAALRGAARRRRWRSAIAIAAAFSLFVAVIGGSALRHPVAAAALPEPAAWTQVHPDVTGHGDPAPAHKNPFQSWMTKDRPSAFNRLSPPSAGSPLPPPFTPAGLRPGGELPAPPAPAGAKRHTLIRLCVARR